MNKYTLSAFFGLFVLCLGISCKSDSTASAGASEASSDSQKDTAAMTAAPIYPKVDISSLRQLSFKETYLYGMKTQGAFRFPVYDEKGNEIPLSELSSHFSANRGMIMYADESGEVKAGMIRAFTEAEINEILQISREMQTNSGSLNTNPNDTK